MSSHLQIQPERDSASVEYDRFASVYNRWMAEDFSRRAFPVLGQIALRHVRPGALVLDLCCGTGHMARSLVEAGFRVTGIDASDEMLRFARQNAPGASFFRADARYFTLTTSNALRSFELVISTFNSLAHIDDISDLSEVFRNVRACLAPGAMFVFDLTMEEAYASKWRGSFALLAENHACIVQPVYDRTTRIGTNNITVFELHNRGSHLEALYLRSDFVIKQKCHSESDLRAALNCAGFPSVEIFDAERDLSMEGEAGRAFFVCR